MNCRDYERAWDERLDARGGESSGMIRALEGHEAACEACRAVGRRYRVLERAIAAMGPAPAPPSGFAGRFAPGGDRETPVVRPLGAWPAVRFAAAAVLMLAGLVLRGGRREVATRPKGPAPDAVAARPLTDSLAEATSATWDLARAASAPAARVGRDAWGEAPALRVPRLPGGPAPAAPEVVRGVGDRVHVGVRPLSGSARHAFGFLLAPGLPGDGRRDPSPSPGPVGRRG